MTGKRGETVAGTIMFSDVTDREPMRHIPGPSATDHTKKVHERTILILPLPLAISRSTTTNTRSATIDRT
jgi:hypothetical protein